MIFSIKADFDTDIEYETTINANRFTNLVARRFYFIARLSKTIDIFHQVQRAMDMGSHLIKKERLFLFNNIDKFKHNLIRHSLEKMQHKTTLKPLFLVWDDFCRFKSLEDQLFVEEFTKEIFVISANLLLSTTHDKNSIQKINSYSLSIQEVLDLIDLYIEYFTETSHKAKIQYKQDNLSDLLSFVHMDQVALRFYHLRRLTVPIHNLQDIAKKNVPITKLIHLDTNITFSHQEVLYCKQQIEEFQDLTALFQLYEDIEHFKFVYDSELIKEFSILLLSVYKNLLITIQPQKSPLIDNALQLYDKIDTAELGKVLDAINLIADELPKLLEKYEFDSEMSWKQWLRKYWWAPPLILGTIALKVAIQYKAKDLLSSAFKNVVEKFSGSNASEPTLKEVSAQNALE